MSSGPQVTAVVVALLVGSPAATPRVVHVPHVRTQPTLDGELTEPAWHVTPTHKFLAPDGTPGRPYSDMRFLWSEGFLHMGLYASDRNLVSAGVGPDGPVWAGDAFRVVFSKDGVDHAFDFGVTAAGGVLSDGERRRTGPFVYAWQSGARFRADMDEGTVDNPRDNDEEWVIEAEIPLVALGLAPNAGTRIEVSAMRCDVDRRGSLLPAPCPASGVLALVFDP